jgi:agmatinase
MAKNEPGRPTTVDDEGRSAPQDGPVGPPDARVLPRFAGPETFARLPRLGDVSRCDVAVFGVPFDGGTSYRPGARFGPSAVRAGSKLLRPFHPGLEAEPFAVQQVADAGDVACNPFDIQQAVLEIEERARELLRAARHVVTIGGDHTISLPLLRAVRDQFGPVALVHFDAHLDTWDTYFGQPYTHGTPFRRATEEGLLVLDRSIHVGTRGPLYAKGDLAEDRDLGFRVVTTMDVARLGVDGVAERIRSRIGEGPVYVSVDVDVMDPAHAPGTGTPELGGMTSRELLWILRAMDGLPIVGADVVEVAPPFDHAELTSMAAANLVYEFLALFARRNQRRDERDVSTGEQGRP